MKEIRVDHTGGPEVLQLAESAVPVPGPDEVLIRQSAAGINYIDVYVRTGAYPRALPFVPGREGVGVVEKRRRGGDRLTTGHARRRIRKAPTSAATLNS